MSLDNFKNRAIIWDTVNKDFPQPIQIMQGDVNARTLSVKIIDNGGEIDLTGHSLKLTYQYTNSSNSGFVMIPPENLTKGEFILVIPTEMTKAGVIEANLILLNEDKEQVIVSKNLTFISDNSTITDLAQEVNNKIDDFTKLLLENMPQVMRSELNDLHAQTDSNKSNIELKANLADVTSLQSAMTELKNEVVNNETTTFTRKNNLFNPDIALVDKIPKWVGYNSDLTSDTNVTSATNFITSNVVQCNEGEVYIYEGGHLGRNIYYADSTKTLKQTIEVANKTSFTIPSGIKYFRVLFTYNDSDYNNNQWKEKFKIVKGNSLENISPYGKNEVKDLTLPNEIVKEHNLSQALKDKINVINSENSTLLIPKNTSYSEGEAILLLNFDGWTQNTFNVMAPYIKEKGIPFTLFFTGYDREPGVNPNDLRNYMKEMGNKFEFAMYTGHPSSTMYSTTNFKEQLAQMKPSYDGIVNYGLPKPKVCSYSGGIKSELTEYLCQNVFGQKIGRTTENSHIVNPVTTAFSIPCSGYGDDGYWPITTVDSTVANKRHIAVMTHNILNGADITDPSYNMRESYLKAWIDKIALEVSKGTLKCMTFYEYYLYTILPHTSSIGQRALVWENDNRQHEYIYTENGWIELTNFQSYK
ncbi:minor head protein [Lactococcus phage phi7]|uniref:BppU N-terminal domain-containing protein n=1 Tax=Lactococcus phage phi7 TaxID=1262538 RepID=R9R1M8_9CAUD|nr:minor head protein [Lactococcus phage phi7]AGI11190.1 hypothetical protein phi7_0011 [Lactococcus phage phi7]